MNRLAINTVGDELETAAAFCRERRLGIEVTDFAFPGNLDRDLNEIIKRCAKAVAGIETISSHGPFFDLTANSQDPAIVEVCERRHRAALRASQAVGASFYVAHTNYTPMIRNEPYRKNFAKRMRDFWLPLADRAGKHGIVICLENLWEPDPSVQCDVVSTIGHPNLKASFDNGHALVFSKLPAETWFQALGKDLAHCHLHDNAGQLDDHAVIGEGKENWPKLLKAAGEFSPEALLVIECDRLEGNRKSLERIQGFPCR